MTPITLDIPGFSIACKTWGSSSNPAILALHGWLDNANSFDQIAAELQNQYYFIAMDLPGHGYSSHLPAGNHYHFIDGVFTVVEVINALKLNSVHLLGHSLGACIASIVAGIAPAHVRSLALFEGLGPLTSPEESAHKQLTRFLSTLSPHTSKAPKGYHDFASAAHARSIKGYVSLEIAARLCERGLNQEQGLYFWRHDKRLLSSSPLQMTENQVLSCLKEIQAKTFLLLAKQGFAFNTELMRHRMNSVRNLTIQLTEGGHHIHMEQPDYVAKLLLEFYRLL
jgi:pimeloyl-ACP methyl ester carboxylesterase